MTRDRKSASGMGVSRIAVRGLLWPAVCLLGSLVANAQTNTPTTAPSESLSSAVVGLLDAPPLPPIVVSPTHRYALLVHEHALLPIRDLAEPMLEISYLRVNPAAYGPHAPLSYYGVTQLDLKTNQSVRIPLPPGVTLSFPRWSPDGSRYAFTVTRETGIELWIGLPDERRALKLLGPELNATTGAPCTWMPDSRRLLCRTVPRPHRSNDPNLMLSPYAQRPRQSQPAQVDGGIVAQVLEAQLEIIDVISGSRHSIGSPMAFESVDPAPGGAHLLVQRLLTPYPQIAGQQSTSRALEVWDITGRLMRSFARNRGGEPRALQWHTAETATLVWAEDAGDGQRIVAQAAPFQAAPNEMFRLEHRFAGLAWLDDARRAIVYDHNPATRSTSLWLIATHSSPAAPQRLIEHSIDTRFASSGSPLASVNPSGQLVVRTQGDGIFLRGQAPVGDTTHHFLDYFDLGTKQTERLWGSAGRNYEPIVELLATEGNLLLTRRETADEPPNYIIHDLAQHTETQLTHFSHPAPGMQAAQRIPLRYTRPDGRELSAVLYVPADASPEQPLPVVMWAYPREFGIDTQSVSESTPERFLDFKRAFRLFFLLRGYAVMDEVAMPIVGNPGEANDTFIQQIVANAQVALDAAAATGLVDPRSAGIAGHSYGAFMVANLLAHSKLFGAGVAMSGAYNRTLTPFGFQTERRSLWEAPEMYMAMSPLLYSNQINAPLLLVHGGLDNNPGTQPIQSQQFYNAIRYNGGRAELLMLPLEGHSYRGRESVLQTASAMLNWFDQHLKSKNNGDALRETGLANASP